MKQGVAFEKAVAALQKRLAHNAEVLHNETLVDRLGHKRQFDVVIRGTVGGHEVIGVIECKDWSRRVGIQAVESFVTKTRELNANLVLIAAKNGFTANALDTAKFHGIGTLSLLPDDPEDSGFLVGARAYADHFQWTAVNLSLAFASKSPPATHPPLEDLYWKHHRLLDWILGFLLDLRYHEERQGVLIVTVDFEKQVRLHTGTRDRYVTGLVFRVRRERIRKTRLLSVRGEAFLRWDEMKLTIPPKGSVEFEKFRVDLKDWDNYDGEIVLPRNSLGFHVKIHTVPALEERWDFPVPYSVRTDWQFQDGIMT